MFVIYRGILGLFAGGDGLAAPTEDDDDDLPPLRIETVSSA